METQQNIISSSFSLKESFWIMLITLVLDKGLECCDTFLKRKALQEIAKTLAERQTRFSIFLPDGTQIDSYGAWQAA